MRVAKLYTLDDIRIEDTAVPEPGPGEVLVRTRVCGICTGDIMSWYIERKAPLVFGHEPAGEVTACGKGVERVREGDRVFVHHHAPCGTCRRCRRGDHVHCKTWRSTGLRPGGMAEYFVAPAANVAGDTLVLPEGFDYERGSLIEPTACVVKSLRRGGFRADDTVAVLGLGIMGQLHVALAAQRGARVIALDRVPFRLERARELGAAETIHVDEGDAKTAVADATGGELADLVIVGPGSIAAMQTGIELAGAGGRVVLFTTSTPEERLAVSPFKLYFEEISLVPSYSCGPDDTRQALALLSDETFPVAQLVTHRFKLEEVARAIEMAGNVNEALKTLVVFD